MSAIASVVRYKGTLAVAQSASEVIGLVSAELVPYFPNGSTICRVTGLVVSTHHRGQGVGEKLLVGAADFAREHHCSGIEIPVRSIGLTRTGSIGGSGSRVPRSDSSRPYKRAY
jgi:GNAT superfamily N-acetyltransferase